MVPIWLLSIRKVKETVPREKLPLLGIAAAFSFLAMMFNVPFRAVRRAMPSAARSSPSSSGRMRPVYPSV